MLSERERRILARIERHLRESDPDLVQLFDRAKRSKDDPAPILLLVTGLVLLVTGSVIAAIPVALIGMAMGVFALVTAHVRLTRFGRPSPA